MDKAKRFYAIDCNGREYWDASHGHSPIQVISAKDAECLEQRTEAAEAALTEISRTSTAQVFVRLAYDNRVLHKENAALRVELADLEEAKYHQNTENALLRKRLAACQRDLLKSSADVLPEHGVSPTQYGEMLNENNELQDKLRRKGQLVLNLQDEIASLEDEVDLVHSAHDRLCAENTVLRQAQEIITDPLMVRCPKCNCRRGADIHKPGYICDYYLKDGE